MNATHAGSFSNKAADGVQHLRAAAGAIHEMRDPKHIGSENGVCAQRVGQQHGVARYVRHAFLRGKDGLQEQAAVRDAFLEGHGSLHKAALHAPSRAARSVTALLVTHLQQLHRPLENALVSFNDALQQRE